MLVFAFGPLGGTNAGLFRTPMNLDFDCFTQAFLRRSSTGIMFAQWQQGSAQARRRQHPRATWLAFAPTLTGHACMFFFGAIHNDQA
jgi:hypothetical protein